MSEHKQAKDAFKNALTLSPDRYKNGVGLISMIKRAELSGGSLVIKSDKKVGTTIQALWPC